MQTAYGKDSTYWLKKWFLSETFREVLDTIPQDSTILDLGCGGGRLALHLASRGIAAWGMDNDTILIQNLQEQHPEMRWHHGNAEQPGAWLGMPYFDWIVSNVCIRKDQCRLETLMPLIEGSSILFRIQGSQDLAGYVDETPCYSEEEIQKLIPGCSIEAEHYAQRFTSADYLRSSIQKIGMQSGVMASNSGKVIHAPREYLVVKRMV